MEMEHDLGPYVYCAVTYGTRLVRSTSLADKNNSTISRELREQHTMSHDDAALPPWHGWLACMYVRVLDLLDQYSSV